MKNVVTLGEIMMRLSTTGFDRFVGANNLEIHYGGGEANVAIGLSNFGHNAKFVTKLPLNDWGKSAINILKYYGVDTSNIIRGGDRIGVYYVEPGVSMRSSKVIYDRKNSSFSKSNLEEYDFNYIFKNCDLFNISGITAAISKECQELTKFAIKKAKENGCLVSYDYNYRKMLWEREESIKFLEDILPDVDILIGYIPKGVDWETNEVDLDEVKKGFEELKQSYGIKLITSTIRESESASDNKLYALLYDGNDLLVSKKHNIRIANRIGAGDAYTAGFLSEYLHNSSSRDILEFAIACSSFKHTVMEDYNICTRDEILKISKGDASGKVER
ncbi:sugar kinase [Helcococcus bovis]|uniref:sugar kinase n=1 Tax=Helcococcus bovis TaxID=3153252 RepID=UPI0038B93BB0